MGRNRENEQTSGTAKEPRGQGGMRRKRYKPAQFGYRSPRFKAKRPGLLMTAGWAAWPSPHTSLGFTSPQAVRGCCCSYVVARPRQDKLNQLGLTHLQGRLPAQSALADPLLALLSLFRHRFQNSCRPKQHHTPFDQIDLEYGAPCSPCRRRRQEAEFFSIETAPGKGGVCYGRMPTPIRRTSTCSHPALVRFPFSLCTQTPFINLSPTLWLNRIDSVADAFYFLESFFIRHFMYSILRYLHAGSPLCVSWIVSSKPMVVVMLTK